MSDRLINNIKHSKALPPLNTYQSTGQINDPVNHPLHYTQGKIECIDFIIDKKLNFCRGSAVKYIVRAGLKDPDKQIEDLEKAIACLKREIETIKAGK